ncbi:MAG: VOC family protein, partial [Chloroflexota bacterium]|nr:VOC family protein [Chloroflexota bacterium]
PRISIITLGVTDLARSTAFYRDGLGFPVHDAGGPSITFFLLENVMLSLYPRDALMAEANPGQADAGQAPHAFTIAHNVAARAEVDAVIAEAEAAGAAIVKPASETFWGGYSGYFADPDSFRWEVATGSGLPVDPSAG